MPEDVWEFVGIPDGEVVKDALMVFLKTRDAAELSEVEEPLLGLSESVGKTVIVLLQDVHCGCFCVVCELYVGCVADMLIHDRRFDVCAEFSVRRPGRLLQVVRVNVRNRAFPRNLSAFGLQVLCLVLSMSDEVHVQVVSFLSFNLSNLIRE